MSCEQTDNLKKNGKVCPICSSEVVLISIYWCGKCGRWLEEIDFLDLSKEEIDEECKKCDYLAETNYKKNDMTIFYCNSFGTERLMEKLRDFRKCSKIKYKH